jgi:putative membrane protein
MIRVLLRFVFSAIGLLVASSLLKGITARSFVDLLVVAVLLGALNATVGALLKALAFLPMACSFGCFSLVINGLVFWLAGSLSHQLGLGFTVSGFWPGFFGALVTSIVASGLGYLFIPKERQRPEPSPRIKIVN